MSGAREHLEGKQQRAIAALLVHPTVARAAVAAGVGESTLRRWLSDAGVRGELRKAGREAVEHAVARLQAGAAEAVEALRKNLKAKRPSDRTRAAQVLLDVALRGVELLDLAGRLEAVESVLRVRGEK